MAFVKSLVRDEREVKSLHPTQIECTYMLREFDGRKILQLNSYGSDGRDIPGKLSQTLQFDERSAQQLMNVLIENFEGLRK